MPYLSAFGAVLTKSSLSGTKFMHRFCSHSLSTRVADVPQRIIDSNFVTGDKEC